MSLSVGILGLPNVGKSTLFKALTKKEVDISNYPFCTIEPNVGVVEVEDERLKKLSLISKPKKVIPSVIKFVDIAGLVKGAHQGEGLGNQFLAHLREVDAILEVVRCFKAENISHINGEVIPQRDIATIKSELILKDLETIGKRLEKIEKDVKARKKEAEEEHEKLIFLKEKLEESLEKRRISFPEADSEISENLFLLTSKPKIYLLNCSKEELSPELREKLEKENIEFFQMDVKEELDKSELNDEERKELGLSAPCLPELIKKCYQILDLITFFTITGVEETRAWPIKRGSTILEAAGKVHSDFKENFIKAEVLDYKTVIEAGSWKQARESGVLKTVGKDYILKDGDVIEIKI